MVTNMQEISKITRILAITCVLDKTSLPPSLWCIYQIIGVNLFFAQSSLRGWGPHEGL
jgi:hypothetical protein